MAMGRPVIATIVEGSVEIVHPGQYGLLVPPGDSPFPAQVLLELGRHPERRPTVETRCRQLAETCHGVETMVRSIERLYLQEWHELDDDAGGSRSHGDA